MDTQTIILIINFILQIIQMFDHSFLKRIKHSKCFLGEIDLNSNNEKDKDKNNDIEKNNKI